MAVLSVSGNKKDRFSILNQALERFTALEERIALLEKQLDAAGLAAEKAAGLASSSAAAAAADGAAGGAASSSSSPQPSVGGAGGRAGAAGKGEVGGGLVNGSGPSSFHSFDSSTRPLTSDVPLSSYNILSCLPTCFIALDGKFKDVNAAFCAILGYERAYLVSTTLFSVTHANELMSTFAQLKRLLSGEIDCWEGPKLLMRIDSAVLPVHVIMTTAKRFGKPEQYVAFIVPKTTTSHMQMHDPAAITAAAAAALAQHQSALAHSSSSGMAYTPSTTLPAQPVGLSSHHQQQTTQSSPQQQPQKAKMGGGNSSFTSAVHSSHPSSLLPQSSPPPLPFPDSSHLVSPRPQSLLSSSSSQPPLTSSSSSPLTNSTLSSSTASASPAPSAFMAPSPPHPAFATASSHAGGGAGGGSAGEQ